ncbi:MAG TPA: hypothetical protein VIJ25_09545, partial [Methylococcales bacterium]
SFSLISNSFTFSHRYFYGLSIFLALLILLGLQIPLKGHFDKIKQFLLFYLVLIMASSTAITMASHMREFEADRDLHILVVATLNELYPEQNIEKVLFTYSDEKERAWFKGLYTMVSTFGNIGFAHYNYKESELATHRKLKSTALYTIYRHEDDPNIAIVQFNPKK